MSTAKVYQYGRYWDSVREVKLPAYTEESYPCLVNGREVTGINRHQLVPCESYGVGSAGSYSVIPGTIPGCYVTQ